MGVLCVKAVLKTAFSNQKVKARFENVDTLEFFALLGKF